MLPLRWLHTAAKLRTEIVRPVGAEAGVMLHVKDFDTLTDGFDNW